MVSTVSIQKQRIRTQTLQQIYALSKTYRRQADTGIQNTILSMPQYLHSCVICYYVSTQYEVNTIQLIKKQLALKNKRIIVPKIDSNNLTLHEITSWKDLHIGTYCIQEPNNTCKRIAPQIVDLFFVPGIAFGNNKTRIGRGVGYYDRLLKKTGGITIGLAYDVQLYATVPHSTRDVQLDIIVTETSTYV